MLVGVLNVGRETEASLIDRKQGLTEISLFAKHDEKKNHLVSIIGVINI